MMLRRLLAAAGALLALFHVWLFAGQIWDGRLDDLALLLRWLAAAGLAVGLAALRRRGLSMVRGRPAATIWLLAALLHGPALAARVDDGGTLGLPEVAATLSQIAVASVAAIGLGLLAARFRRAPGFAQRRTFLRPRDRDRLAAHAAAFLVVLSPRPPPAAA
jgi:hypothetical protein